MQNPTPFATWHRPPIRTSGFATQSPHGSLTLAVALFEGRTAAMEWPGYDPLNRMIAMPAFAALVIVADGVREQLDFAMILPTSTGRMAARRSVIGMERQP